MPCILSNLTPITAVNTTSKIVHGAPMIPPTLMSKNISTMGTSKNITVMNGNI
jgi:hypothetical protein